MINILHILYSLLQRICTSVAILILTNKYLPRFHFSFLVLQGHPPNADFVVLTDKHDKIRYLFPIYVPSIFGTHQIHDFLLPPPLRGSQYYFQADKFGIFCSLFNFLQGNGLHFSQCFTICPGFPVSFSSEHICIYFFF